MAGLASRAQLFAAVMIFALGVTGNIGAISRAHSARADMEPLRKLALELVNQSRAAENLPPLRLESKLTEAAQFHADDMLRRNYYAHSSPEGKSVSDRFQAAGGDRWLLTAENIAKCDGCTPPLSEDNVRQMHEGWMNSPGHRANILRKGLTTLGYGLAVNESGRLYAVQTFAGPGTPQGADDASESRPLPPSEQLDIALRELNARRKAADVAPLKPADALTAATRKLAPSPGDPEFRAETGGDIYGALAPAEQKDWASLTLLVATCGGCGTAPVEADIVYFTKQWLQDDNYAKVLLSEEATHLGFAVVANGRGKKVALGLVGTHR